MTDLSARPDPAPLRGLSPRDHIDRNGEQELFRGVVTYQSPARILTICDRGGRGKSSLLARLKYNCEFEIKPRVPCCLLELDDDEREPTPFALVSAVVTGFTAGRGENVRDRFAKFTQVNDARMDRMLALGADQSARRGAEPQAVGRAYAATMYGGKNIGANFERADKVIVSPVPQFTDDQEQRARELVTEAFFDDLRSTCATRPMVLLLDGWERCNLSLRDWIFQELLGNHVLHPETNLRPDKFAVVIAGRPYEPGDTPFGLRLDELRPLFDSDEDFSASVRSIKSLSEWDSDHIREFMVLNGCREPTDVQVNLIREQLSRGKSLEKIVSLIDQFFRE
jgi:hypothetical protein